jgi:CreA protein
MTKAAGLSAQDYVPELTLSFTSPNRKAAAQWYRDHLGFELIYDVQDIGWCEIRTHTPGVSIGFAESDTPSGAGCVPVFGVADIDSARRKLEAAGVRFDGPTQHQIGMVKLATFYDRDGNALMLSQNLMTD